MLLNRPLSDNAINVTFFHWYVVPIIIFMLSLLENHIDEHSHIQCLVICGVNDDLTTRGSHHCPLKFAEA